MNIPLSRKIYPARIDVWLWCLMAACSFGLALWGVLALPENQPGGLLLIGVGVFDGILFAALLFPCRYTIDGDHVLIRSGVLHYRVPISEICSVRSTINPLSAPAPSLRRVEIRMKSGKFHLVSPKDRDGFIQELSRRAGLVD